MSWLLLSFSFNISPSNEYSGLISFRIDWFDLAVQGTLKSLLRHRSSKALAFQYSAFFMVQKSLGLGESAEPGPRGSHLPSHSPYHLYIPL